MRPPALALLGIACSAALGAACKCEGKGRRATRDAASAPTPRDAAPRPVVPDKIEGWLTLDGKPLEILRCRPGHEGTVYIDLVTAAGALRFVGGETERMFWNADPDANRRGAPLDCSIPHRSWGGGQRADGTAYFRGELALECQGPPGALRGKVALDCGNIDSYERGLLDERRREKREELDR
jgi:hypothetical protein